MNGKPTLFVRRPTLAFKLAALGVVTLGASGCLVGQKPGLGQTFHRKESKTGGWYWLYLPQGYDDAPADGSPRAKHPLVMTFHGMKPFDNEHSQIREWQQEADRYGFVVCAPSLSVSAFGAPLPLSNPNNGSLKRDEKRIIAIMDEIYRTTNVDPNKVLATCWSYGGYVAHYMANRYPERFSCVVVKQSNFNADLLDTGTVSRYLDRPVAVYYTENDFAICQRESRQAAEWYARHGFDVEFAVFESLGHERTPSVAAQFFARTCGAEAKTPPLELARLQVKIQDVVTNGNGRRAEPATAARFRSATLNDEGGAGVPASHLSSPAGAMDSAGREQPALRSMPLRGAGESSSEVAEIPLLADERPGYVYMRLSSTIGLAPLTVAYSAVIPAGMREGSGVVWTDNGEPMSSQLSGEIKLAEPGDHKIELVVTSRHGERFRDERTVTVLADSKP